MLISRAMSTCAARTIVLGLATMLGGCWGVILTTSMKPASGPLVTTPVPEKAVVLLVRPTNDGGSFLTMTSIRAPKGFDSPQWMADLPIESCSRHVLEPGWYRFVSTWLSPDAATIEKASSVKNDRVYIEPYAQLEPLDVMRAELKPGGVYVIRMWGSMGAAHVRANAIPVTARDGWPTVRQWLASCHVYEGDAASGNHRLKLAQRLDRDPNETDPPPGSTVFENEVHRIWKVYSPEKWAQQTLAADDTLPQ